MTNFNVELAKQVLSGGDCNDGSCAYDKRFGTYNPVTIPARSVKMIPSTVNPLKMKG